MNLADTVRAAVARMLGGPEPSLEPATITVRRQGARVVVSVFRAGAEAIDFALAPTSARKLGDALRRASGQGGAT